MQYGIDEGQRCAATLSITFAPNRKKHMIMVLPKIELKALAFRAINLEQLHFSQR
jgi:hypothetical protein